MCYSSIFSIGKLQPSFPSRLCFSTRAFTDFRSILQRPQNGLSQKLRENHLLRDISTFPRSLAAVCTSLAGTMGIAGAKMFAF